MTHGPFREKSRLVAVVEVQMNDAGLYSVPRDFELLRARDTGVRSAAGTFAVNRDLGIPV